MDSSFNVVKEISLNLAGDQFKNMRSIIARFYCGKLRVNGICNRDCLTSCKPHLIVMLLELEKGNNPGALLTWRAKNEAAKMLEKHREEERNEPDHHIPVIFDRPPTPENPFIGFLETLK